MVITVAMPAALGLGTPVDLPALKGNKTNELWFYHTGDAFAAVAPRPDNRTGVPVTNSDAKASASAMP